MSLGKFLSQYYSSLTALRTASRAVFDVTRINRISTKMGCSQTKFDITSNKPPTNTDDDYIEKVLCRDADLAENQMKTFDMDEEGKVLLVKQRGKISALGPKCTHYNAPLVEGALGDGRIRCQWHGACFNILTGDIEDFPGLDSIPCHQVTVDCDGNVKVRAKKSALKDHRRVNAMASRSCGESRSVVVIGGGPAGATCVETLRREGFQGAITLVCRETVLPYDRVKVSKAMDFDIEKSQFRTEDFYKEHGIDVLRGTPATSVDVAKRTVTVEGGRELPYDRLFVATGCRARKADLPGNDLDRVVVLRDNDDAKRTLGLLSPDRELVVLGSSFVAMEAANYCLNKVKKVTVVARGEYPFEPFLGARVGAAFRKMFEDKGVVFLPNSGISRCVGDSSNGVASVELVNGCTLKADIVIMGTGSTYNTDFLRESGVEMREDGTIECDDRLRTNVAEVYAGGDIAYAPVWSHHGKKSAIGHYPLAHYHGKVAALNMIGKDTELRAVPYFWTMLFGKSLRYAGHGKFDDILYHGDVEALKFVAFYLQGDEVVAAASVGMDPVVSQFAEMLAQGEKIARKELDGDKLAWVGRLHQH